MLNWSAVVLVGVVHVLVVYPIVVFGRSHESLWVYMGPVELPRATNWVLRYSTSSFPHMVGGVLAMLSVAGLGYVMVAGKGRHQLPFFISLAWAAVLLHVLAVWVVLSLPLLRVTWSTGNP